MVAYKFLRLWGRFTAVSQMAGKLEKNSFNQTIAARVTGRDVEP